MANELGTGFAQGLTPDWLRFLQGQRPPGPMPQLSDTGEVAPIAPPPTNTPQMLPSIPPQPAGPVERGPDLLSPQQVAQWQAQQNAATSRVPTPGGLPPPAAPAPSPAGVAGALSQLVLEQPPEQQAKIYNTLRSGAQWLINNVGAAVPPELRGKVASTGQVVDMFNPQTAYNDYRQAMREGHLGEAALSATGLIPGESFTAGLVKAAPAIMAGAAARRTPSRGHAPAEQRAVERMADEGPVPEPRVPVPEGPAEAMAEAVRGRASRKGRDTAIAQSGLRDMPLEQAIDYVRQGKHLLAREADGSFVGAPHTIKTGHDLHRQRAEFDESVRIGSMIGGERWYDEGRGVVSELTRGDPKEGSFMAGSLGVTSSQATPHTNLGFELQGHNAYEMGERRPITRTGASARTLIEARDAGVNPKTGLKTGVYQVNLDPSRPWSTTGTNDIWHARALGYVDEAGNPWDKSLSGKQHAWMDAETIAAVDRANQIKLGGRSDWKSHEIQAAAWVGKKAQAIAAEKGIPIEAALKEAQAGYKEALPAYQAFGTYDHIPGAATGHLPRLQGDSAARAAYSADPRSSYTDPQGYDIFYKAMGPRERPTLPTTGVFQSSVEGSPLEISKGGAARPLASLKGGTGARTWDDPSLRMIRGAEGARAYIGGQEMGAASMLFPENASGARRSVQFETPTGALTPGQVAELATLGEKYGVPNVVHLGEQGYLTRFGPKGAEGAEDLRNIREAVEGKIVKGERTTGGMADELANIVPGASPRRTDVRTTDVDYSKEWQQGHGSGAVTRKLREVLGDVDTPLLVDKLDASPEIRANALAQLQRDAEVAARTGDPVREDLQNARRIIHEKGFRGLFDALDLGEVALPAVTVAALVPLLARHLQQGQGASDERL